MEFGGPRWKGKSFVDIAAQNPMSELVKQLQSSLAQSKARAILSGCISLLDATAELADLLNRTSFGRQIATSEKDEYWFQLSSEETFFMCHSLQSLAVVNESERPLNENKLWDHMRASKAAFPELYKAYSHLRKKNWVVRAGAQYGVDFVAYRHHPALVHSEYAVLVLQDGGENKHSGRLRVWSDLQRCLRVSGSVAKTLLVLYVNENGSDVSSPCCLEQFSVEERMITRWAPEQCRDGSSISENETERIE
ncbi:putative tRNA-splicing endonuclease subunit Sen2 [Apostasia shenzhenica]|uniref:tRNA-intron lyase n=1 Tax=Apostasia shenzhenica TaxID=1088818 RepID=A0A2I0AYP2_9ASPA|nr:putative tRNA-splicing endonuclease subunit Sen2 [Apostasia shenzhenica]